MLQKVSICGVDTTGLPKLSHKENEELMQRLKAGDKAARDKFIVGNMRLVLSLVKRFWAKNANADDVFQAGCVGLIKAIDGFDLSFHVKFSTYAVPMILGEIKRYLRDGNSLRVSRSIRDRAYRILKVRESIEERDEEATIEKIAAALKVQEREVVYALDAISASTNPCTINRAIRCSFWISCSTNRRARRSGRSASPLKTPSRGSPTASAAFCSSAITRGKRRRRSRRRSASRRRRSPASKRTPSEPSGRKSHK